MSHKQEREEHATRLREIKAKFAPVTGESIEAAERRLSGLRMAVAKYCGPHGVTMGEADQLAGGLGLMDVGPPPEQTEDGKRRETVRAKLLELKAQHAGDPSGLRTAVALLMPRHNLLVSQAEEFAPDIWAEEQAQAEAEEQARQAKHAENKRVREGIAALRAGTRQAKHAENKRVREGIAALRAGTNAPAATVEAPKRSPVARRKPR